MSKFFDKKTNMCKFFVKRIVKSPDLKETWPWYNCEWWCEQKLFQSKSKFTLAFGLKINLTKLTRKFEHMRKSECESKNPNQIDEIQKWSVSSHWNQHKVLITTKSVTLFGESLDSRERESARTLVVYGERVKLDWRNSYVGSHLKAVSPHQLTSEIRDTSHLTDVFETTKS